MMIDIKKRIAIVPARSGSKGIVNKNMTNLGGDPLISYTLKILSKLKNKGIIDDFIVSTDSQEIADYSKLFGAWIPYLRPKDLAEDHSKTIDLVENLLQYFEKKKLCYESIVLLQPTSPLRNEDDVVGAINLFEQGNKQTLISVYHEEGIKDSYIYYKNEYNIGTPKCTSHNKGNRRQDSQEIYIRNGAIYITKTDYIKKEKNFIDDAPLLFEMPKNRSVNIDCWEDLLLAEWILERRRLGL